MPGTRRRGAVVCTGLAALLLAGCGSSKEPEPLEPMDPAVPADLCSVVPEETRTGLAVNASSSTEGNPTAACSLRSADNAANQVRAVVTWTQLNDESSADTVLQSQCRAIDPQEYGEIPGLALEGADEACGGKGIVPGTDAATLAAVRDRIVLTVRVTATPPAPPAAVDRATQMAQGVLASMEDS